MSWAAGMLDICSRRSISDDLHLQVYKRQAGKDTQQLLKESEARNGNHKEVLKRFGVKLW
jgi:hypothetical protein